MWADLGDVFGNVFVVALGNVFGDVFENVSEGVFGVVFAVVLGDVLGDDLALFVLWGFFALGRCLWGSLQGCPPRVSFGSWRDVCGGYLVFAG